MKFALELFVPEKIMQAGRNSAPGPERNAPGSERDAPGSERDASPETAPTTETSSRPEQPAPRREARSIIEELDHAQFGGPSFGPQTMELLSKAMEAAAVALDEPATDKQLRSIAATLLKAAGDGERDPARLKAAAMSDSTSASMSASMSSSKPITGTTNELPPST